MSTANEAGVGYSSEMGFETMVSCGEIFRKDPCFTNRRNEVGVAYPSWNDMEVQVLLDARACGFAEVHPDVETVGMILLAQRDLGSLRELEHISGGFLVQPGKRPGVLVWNDHQVPAGIWKQIENDKNQFSPIENEVVDVVLAGLDFTEYAGILGLRGRNVAVAPGTPDVVHTRQLGQPK